MSTPRPIVTLRTDILLRLLPVLALVVLPHLVHLPLWLNALVLTLGLWRYMAARHGLRLPGSGLRILFTAILLFVIHSQYGTLLGRDAGAALLIAMLALKLLEMRENRDVYVAVFLGYFLMVVQFLYSQEPVIAIYMLATVGALTAVLIDLNRLEPAPLRESLRLAATMVAYALPLMVVAFVLFPRISGPLWGLPNDAYGGMSGLSNEMSPGRISQLSLSDAVAFRVSFEGQPPPPQQRYWRGPVFSLTDGESWRSAPRRADAPPPSYTPRGTPLRYTVTLEPHNRLWIFALDLPASVPPFGKISEEFEIDAAQAVRERVRYTLSSYPEYNTGDIDLLARRRALQLPSDGSPRARALTAEWRTRGLQPAEMVQAALQMFRTQEFVYTLNPPLITDDFVDSFLFNTRRGFCEHYAASFAFLMRAAGVPARVVTGYQGGELNELGQYFIVRQRDAHAWTEVWLKERGWVRVDPTAAVAPERIERGIDLALQRDGEAVRFMPSQAAWFSELRRGIRNGWDAFNNRWNQWVLAYGPQRQHDLLSWLSMGGLSWQTVAAGLMATAGTLVAMLLVWKLKAQRQTRDAVSSSYRRFCEKLARRGLARAAHEGPADYAQRIGGVRPELAAQIHSITGMYIAMRYRSADPRSWLARLRREVRAFHP